MGRVAWLLLLSLCLCCCLSTARASSSSLVLDAEVDMEADSEALQLQWVEKPGKASGGATKTGASAADTTKKGASSSARGGRAPAASRLTSSVHKSKYARFVAKHPKRAKKHPKGFETFVKNREKIVALNDKYASKATATPFKSSGPFADLSPSEFKKKFLNVKSHRGRGKGKPVKSGKGSRTKASGSTDSKKKSVSIPRAEKGTSKKRKGSRAMLEIMTKGDGHRVGGAGSGVKKSGKTGGDSGGSVDKSGKTGGDGGSSVDKSGKTGGGGNAVGWSGSNSNPTTNSQVNGWNGLDFLKSTLATAYSGQVASLNAAPAVITIQDVVKSLNSAGVTTAQFNAALSILAVPRKYYGDFPIFQQDECGSCWAQVASNAVYANTKPIRPSIQQLLDCVKTTETDGCNGGTPMDAIDFMAKTPLADIEQYPTLGGTQVGQCKQFPARSFSQPKLSVSGWSMAIPACTQENCAGQQKYELDILNQTRQLTLGTRPIMYVDASKWQHYSGGIFPITECSSTLSAGNHVVELAGAGYDQASQMPYWLIRNSWGTDWGEQGLIKVPFGVNACSISSLWLTHNAAANGNTSFISFVRAHFVLNFKLGSIALAADVMCAGTSHSCAIRVPDGVLICNTNPAASPPSFLSDPTHSDFRASVSVVCGNQYTCVMLQPNVSQTAFQVPVSTVVCFGNGQDGSATPLQILPDAAISMSMGARQLIYIDGNNQINVQPWGTEPDYQPSFSIPDPVYESTEHSQISCSVFFCCSLYLNQTISCYGNIYPFNQICEFPSLDEPVIPTKLYPNCYRRTADPNNTVADLWCWSSALNPHQETEAGFVSPLYWVRVSSTLGGVYALRSDGVMWAYGFDYGVRGLPSGRFLTMDSTPQDQQICAISLQAQMQCWGQNPIQAPSGQFRAVSTSVAHACAAQICVGASCLIKEWLKCFPSNIQDATQRQSILFPHSFTFAVPDSEAKIVCGITEPLPLPSSMMNGSTSLVLRKQLLCYEDPFNFNRENIPPACLGVPSCPSVISIASHHGFFCALFNYTEHIEWLVQHQQPIPPVSEQNNLVCFGSVNGNFPALRLTQPKGLFSQVTVQESTVDAHPPFNTVPFGCVLQQNSIPICWSVNSTYFASIPQIPFLSITGGYMAACGILQANNSIACFGPRAHNLTVPTGVFSQLICSSDSESCLTLRMNGSVECFSYLTDFCPFIIPPLRKGFTAIQLALGQFHMCVVYNDGFLQCNSLPELSTSVVIPQAYPPQGILFQSVFAQEDTTCGVELGTQHVWCFGSLGLGSVMLLNTTVPQFQYARNPLNNSYCQSGTWSGWSGSPTSLCSGFCSAGRFSQSHQESSAVCSGEAQPGFYSAEGSSWQTECPPHTFSPTAGSSSCSSCFSQVYNARSSCGIKNCSAGYSSSDDDCIPCPIGHVSPGSVASCIVCPGESFTPVTSAADSCVLCTGIVGVTCSAGLVNVTQGFYAWLTEDSAIGVTVRTIRCPSDRCSGDLASSLNTTELLVPPCSTNRVLSATNYLCRECIEGTREWNGDCVPDCDQVKWGLVVLLLVICTLYCYLLHVLAQRETGLTSVLMFFAQTVFLQLGSLAEWLQYLGIFSLAPHQLTGKTCVAPLTSFELLAVDAIIPLVFFALLLVIVFLQILYKTIKRMRTSKGSLDAELDGQHHDFSLNDSYALNSLSQPVSGGCCAHFAASAREYTWSAFGRTTLNLFLFGYLQVSVTCFRYLQCVEVGGDDKKLKLLYTQPNIDCSSSEYSSYKPLVILLLVFVVILAPIALLAYGFIHRTTIKEYLSSVNQRGAEDDSQLPTRSTSATIFGVLTDGYRAEAWWWSLLLLLSRTSYASFSILLALDPTSKYLSFHLLNLALLCAANLVRPFEGEAIPSIRRWIENRNSKVSAADNSVSRAELHFPVAACSNATLQLTTLSLLIISSLQLAYSISGSNALATGGTPSLWLQLVVSFFVIVPILLCCVLIARGLYDTRVRPLLRRGPQQPSRKRNVLLDSDSASSSIASASFNADVTTAHPATAPSSSNAPQSSSNSKQPHLSSSLNLREPLLEMKQFF